MYLYSLVSVIFDGVVVLALGLFVLLRNKKSPVNRTFFMMNVAAGIWALGNAMWLIQKSETSLLFWGRVFSFGMILVPVLFFNWVLNILGEAKNKKKILIASYLITCFFVLFSFSKYFISGLIKLLPYQPPGPQAGPLFLPALFFGYLGLFTYSFFLLIKNFRKSSGYKRSQLKYIIIGITIAYIGGIANFPLFLGIKIDLWGLPLVAIYTFIFAYAIVKYRLMDIRLIIKRTVIFSIIVFLITIVYVLAILEPTALNQCF